MAEGVKPNFRAVRYEHPFGARRVDGIFPGLLDGAFVAPRHYGVEVVRARPFQFEGRENGPFAARERPKSGIHGACAESFFRSNRECFSRAVWRVAKHRDENRLDELAPDGCFLGFAKIWMANLRRFAASCCCPVGSKMTLVNAR